MMPSSRRVHGRHPLLPAGGAAVDWEGSDPAATLAEAERLAAALRGASAGTALGPVAVRVRNCQATLALASFPEHRNQAAELIDHVVLGDPAPASPVVEPAIRACLERIEASGRPYFFDEVGATIGVGRRETTWEWDELPFAADTDLAGRHAPVVLVSGTNGKTTTANLVGAIAWADGWMSGVATSNGVRIGRDWEARGDWSGAEAARRVLRHDDVNYAVLETARGGILRRGVLVANAHVAILTNVSEDHLGEGGLFTVDHLAETKLELARSLAPGGTVVVNRDDGPLQRALVDVLMDRPDLVVVRFSTRGRADAWLDGEVLRFGDEPICLAGEVPLSLGGTAVHNLDNALAAALAARATGVGLESIREGLAALTPTPEDNPGRGNLFQVNGASALLEYAHNPESLRRLGDLSRRWPARRRAVLLGQAGDRSEQAVRGLAAEAAALGGDHYVLKPLPGYARGRDPAEVVGWLRSGLLDAGVPPDRIQEVGSELEGVATLLAWSRPGDLLFVLVHEELDAAVALLRAASQPVPGA